MNHYLTISYAHIVIGFTKESAHKNTELLSYDLFFSVLEQLFQEYNVAKFTIVKLTNNNLYHSYYQNTV